ncbi:putative membrane protein [Prauserella shujinwangii]|uniref:Putative membrane protein n=1 Tax=Prauserella shujinwangii TaxID=1453103 RepID=A0A2T0LR71_9PSEU|nr:SHOCT domain-containing protein [Prauserella shujinwangii]PRX45935.1 putative membrane protein [Prauserella shujinwangii]
MPYWDHGYWNGGWLGGLLMVIMMIVFWGGLITITVLLLRRFTHPGGGQRPSGDAQRILDERFARGEIDQEEYERRRAVLRR